MSALTSVSKATTRSSNVNPDMSASVRFDVFQSMRLGYGGTSSKPAIFLEGLFSEIRK